MDTYVNSSGKTATSEQAEQEYRKQLIVAGKPLSGTEYDAGLSEWLTTYTPITKGDQRSISAALITFMVGAGISAIVAMIALVSGGGLLAFVLIFVIGAFMSFGLAGIVVIFTSPTKKTG